jgi:TP53 regulating kinase-like protein
MPELIAQGAEARLYRDGERIIKERPVKGYRLPELDKRLRLQRLRREAKLLGKLAAAGVPVPAVIAVDEQKMTLTLQYLDGPRVRDVFPTDPAGLGREIGTLVGRMHALGIAHADLTTSNMVYVHGKVWLLDFGLAFATLKIEDYAVDLHLLDQAINARHHEHYHTCMPAVFEGYRQGFPQKAEDVLRRLATVEGRGRYKQKRATG